MLYFIPLEWVFFVSFIIFSGVKAEPLVIGFTKTVPTSSRLSELLSNRAAGLALQEKTILNNLGVDSSSKKSSDDSDDDMDDNEARTDNDDGHNATTSITNSFGVRNYLWSYLLTVGIGHPKQEFKLILDTGSSVLWVPSSKCDEKKCPGASSVNLFDTSASSSYKKEEGNKFSLDYGSGGCSGESGQDSVFIGEMEVKHQMIGVADQVSKDLLTDGVNGIFGFGPTITSQLFNSKKEKWPTPLDEIVANGDIKKKLFSIYFDHVDNEDELETANGRLILGDLPPREQYTGELQWANLFSQGTFKDYWSITSQGVKVNNKRIPAQLRGIVDTGTTMTILAPEFGKKVIAALKIAKFDLENRLYYVDCKKISSLPTLTFLLDDHIELSLTPEQYTAPAWQTDFWLVKQDQCPLYLSTDTATDFDFILGQKFLEYHVTVHDADKKRIGFAPNVHHQSIE